MTDTRALAHEGWCSIYDPVGECDCHAAERIIDAISTERDKAQSKAGEWMTLYQQAAAENAELREKANALGQLLAHIHLHLTNDEDFDADELEADMRKLDAGKWIDTESLLIKERTENAELKRQLAEVDELLATYGIDTVGTGPGVTKKEDARVDAIVDAASKRHASRPSDTGKE